MNRNSMKFKITLISHRKQNRNENIKEYITKSVYDWLEQMALSFINFIHTSLEICVHWTFSHECHVHSWNAQIFVDIYVYFLFAFHIIFFSFWLWRFRSIELWVPCPRSKQFEPKFCQVPRKSCGSFEQPADPLAIYANQNGSNRSNNSIEWLNHSRERDPTRGEAKLKLSLCGTLHPLNLKDSLTLDTEHRARSTEQRVAGTFI